MSPARTIHTIFILFILTIVSCSSEHAAATVENVTGLAEALQDAGLGQTGSAPGTSTELYSVSAKEGMTLTGSGLEVELYMFDNDTELKSARTAAESSGHFEGSLIWGNYLILIVKEPSDGHVRRALEIVGRGDA